MIYIGRCITLINKLQSIGAMLQNSSPHCDIYTYPITKFCETAGDKKLHCGFLIWSFGGWQRPTKTFHGKNYNLHIF